MLEIEGALAGDQSAFDSEIEIEIANEIAIELASN